MNDPKRGFVTYEKVETEYFTKRGLKRYAGVWSLWALGVGAVISGDFSGWNLGIQYSGFGVWGISGGHVYCHPDVPRVVLFNR